MVGRPLPGIELGRAVAGIDRTAVPSLGTWLRWAHGLRRFAELGLVGLDELTLAGLDERLLPESGGGAVGRMLFGVKEGNGGLGSLLCIGAVPPDHSARSKYGSIRPMTCGWVNDGELFRPSRRVGTERYFGAQPVLLNIFRLTSTMVILRAQREGDVQH